MAELTFASLSAPDGGNFGAIAVSPSIPHAQDGFEISWADANIDPFNLAGAYQDTVWITNDNQHDSQGQPVVVWLQVIDLPDLAPQQSDSRVVSVPAGAVASGRHTIHVYIDSSFRVPEEDFTDSSNYSFNSIDINS